MSQYPPIAKYELRTNIKGICRFYTLLGVTGQLRCKHILTGPCRLALSIGVKLKIYLSYGSQRPQRTLESPKNLHIPPNTP